MSMVNGRKLMETKRNGDEKLMLSKVHYQVDILMAFWLLLCKMSSQLTA